MLTGLRKGELASLTVAHLHLDDAVPFAALDAADEKNREGNDIALRDDLAADLRDWLADKLRRLQEEALADRRRRSRPGCRPIRRCSTCRTSCARFSTATCASPASPKRDDRGRTLDVHALRHTFGTLLSKGGVAPRTAQAAMRHSKIDLTMNVYTDPRLLDVRGALDALPSLPLSGDQAEGEALQATGTDGDFRHADYSLAPTLAPTPDNSGASGVNPCHIWQATAGRGRKRDARRNCLPCQKKTPADNSCQRVSQSGRYRT